MIDLDRIERNFHTWQFNPVTSIEIAEIAEYVPLLLARVRELEALLRDKAWDHEGACHWCGEFRSHGHTANCPWQAAMGMKEGNNA